MDFEYTPEFREALVLDLTQQAENGDADAQYYLGMRHLTDPGRYKQTDVGYRWLRAAAEQNHPRAQYQLALDRLRSLRGNRNKMNRSAFEKVENWLTVSAEQGYGPAQYALSALYEEYSTVLDETGEKHRYWCQVMGENSDANMLMDLRARALFGVVKKSAVIKHPKF